MDEIAEKIVQAEGFANRIMVSVDEFKMEINKKGLASEFEILDTENLIQKHDSKIVNF